AARPLTDEGEHGWEMLHRRRSLGAVVTLGVALLPLAHGLSQGPPTAPPSRETVQVISPAAARALARKTAATALVNHRARAGTYYYLCQVLGHARMGMYGELVVR